MLTALSVVTIICLLVPVYVYVGYPLLLIVLSKLVKPKPVDRKPITPKVSFIVSCYNEADVIVEKINNCLSLDYPRVLIEFIFISDGSTDGTDELVRECEDERVKLMRQEGRLGKTCGLNMGVPEATGEIVVFSDANAMYDSQAIHKLVRNFNDEKVGYVVGAALYTDSEETSAAQSENIYWRYEIYMKKIESSLHSVVGGDGAIYAIRHHLYEPLNREDINDFVNPLQIIAKGYRGIFDEEAVCYEQTAGDFDEEGKRKKRIVNRSFTALMRNKIVLNPFKYGFYSLEILSHKLLRWMVPFFLIGFIAGTLVLAQMQVQLFQVFLLIGILGGWVILLGGVFKQLPSLPSVFLYPYYFYLVNVSAIGGVIESLKGRVQVTWVTHREVKTANGSTRGGVFFMLVIVFLISICLFYRTLVALL